MIVGLGAGLDLDAGLGPTMTVPEPDHWNGCYCSGLDQGLAAGFSDHVDLPHLAAAAAAAAGFLAGFLAGSHVAQVHVAGSSRSVGGYFREYRRRIDSCRLTVE